MKKTANNSSKTTLARYLLAGIIVVTVTLAMLAVSNFILTGTM